MILEGAKVFKETPTLSYADVHMGIPTMIICVQMVPFAIFIHFAFSTKPYIIQKSSGESIEMLPEADEKGRPVPRAYQGGPGGLYAWAAYMNPLEYASEIRSMYRTLHHIHVRKQKPIYKSDLEAEKLEDSDKPDDDTDEDRTSLGYEQTPNDMTHHGRDDTYNQAQIEQSQPLMPHTQYPAQTHQTYDPSQNIQNPAEAHYATQLYDPPQNTAYSAHPVQSNYATQLYDPPQDTQYQQGQGGQTQYIQPQHGHSHSQQYGQSDYNGNPFS